jgi:hypothetical protein
MSFAGSLKDAIAAIFNWDRELLEGSTKASREWREQVDPWWADRLGIPDLTPRWVLQQWGTEVARKGFHDSIWVMSLNRRLMEIKDNVVLTDCRFPNELNAIKNAGGITMRTHRGSNPEWYKYAEIYNTFENAGQRELCMAKLNHYNVHASEYSSVGLDYDHHLDNNKTVTELHKQIASVINL